MDKITIILDSNTVLNYPLFLPSFIWAKLSESRENGYDIETQLIDRNMSAS